MKTIEYFYAFATLAILILMLIIATKNFNLASFLIGFATPVFIAMVGNFKK